MHSSTVSSPLAHFQSSSNLTAPRFRVTTDSALTLPDAPARALIFGHHRRRAPVTSNVRRLGGGHAELSNL
jgi:hypothetical protein